MASMPPFHIDLTATDHASPVVERLTAANQRLGRSVDATGGFFARNRRVMQQFGFQAGDVAVQIGGGQSAMLAFTQQGSQMLQFFGAFGALAGAAVAVLGSLAIALTRSGALTITTAGAMKRLDEHTGDAVNSLKELSKIQAEIKGLESIGLTSTVSALIALNKAAETDVLARMSEELKATSDALSDVVEVEGALSGLAAAWERLKIGLSSVDLTADHQALNELQDRAQRATGAMQELEVALKGDNAGLIVARLQRLRNLISELGDEGKDSAEAVRQLTPLIFERLSAIGATLEKEREIGQQLEKNKAAYIEMGASLRNAVALARLEAEAQAQHAANIAYSNAQLQKQSAMYSNLLVKAKVLAGYKEFGESMSAAPSLTPQQKQLKDQLAQYGAIVKTKNATIELDKWLKEVGETGTKAIGGGGSGGGVTEKVKELTYELTEAGREAKTLADGMASTIGSELLAMSDRTKTVADAFRSMARDIIKQLYDVLVVQRLVGSWNIDSKTGTGSGTGLMGLIMQGVGGLFGGAKMATPSFAGGGYTGSGSRSGGIDGRGGFAAVLHPNETVVDHSKGGGGEATVVQNIEINAMSDGDIDRVLAKRLPQLKNAVLAAVRNERRRGAVV